MRRAPARGPPYHRPMTPNAPLRSTTRGDVPPEGPLRLGGIDLPAGLHVRPADDDADFDAVAAVSDAPPCAWVTEEAVETGLVQQWVRHLASRFGDTGLWPIAVTGYDDGLERPWRSGEVLGPDEGSDFDVEAFLLSPGELDGVEDPEIVDYLESIAPIATVRELGGPVAAPPAGPQDLLVPWGDARPVALALIPAVSPADALTTLGWMGPANYGLAGAGIARIAVSWEERYHLTPVGIDFDLLMLQMPPRGLSRPEVMSLLAEVYRVCPDSYEQSGFPDLAAFVRSVESYPVLGLWWD